MHSLNVHRILLSSVMVAAKFLDDFYYSNEFWAKIGGVPNSELNTLELEFLFMTNFDLHVCLPPCPPLQSHTLIYAIPRFFVLDITPAKAKGVAMPPYATRNRQPFSGCLFRAVSRRDARC